MLAAILAIMSLGSLFIPLRLNLSFRQHLAACGLLAIPFVIWVMMPGMNHMTVGQYADCHILGLYVWSFSFKVFYIGGLYFCTLNLMNVFRKNRDPLTLPGLALLLAIMAGYKAGPWYIPCISAQVIFSIIYCLTIEHEFPGIEARKGFNYWLKVFGTMGILFLMGFGIIRIFTWTETKVNVLTRLTALPLSFSKAFSDESSLDSIEDLKGSNRVVLRITSRSNPTYFVGKVFRDFDYKTSKWRVNERETLEKPIKEPVELRAQYPDLTGNLFHLGADMGRDRREAREYARIVITSLSTDILFAPRKTLFALVDSNDVRLNSSGVIFAALSSTQGEYGLAFDSTPGDQEEDDKDRYLTPLKDFPDYIKNLNSEIVSSQDSQWEKSQKILDFFHKKFRYGNAPKSGQGETSLEEFLLRSREGKCQLFATGMTLLLRLNKIPSRCVNGFLVEEYNRTGRYYVAREKDAHAWVEAWFPGRGWVTLDPTPPEVRKAPSPLLLTLKELYDVFLMKIHGIKARLMKGDPRELIRYIGAELGRLIQFIISSPLRAAVFLLIVLGLIIWRARRFSLISLLKKRMGGTGPGEARTPGQRMLRDILRRFEKVLSRKKLLRPGDMTLLEFSGSLGSLPESQRRSIQEFVEDYCRLRFGEDDPDEKEAGSLLEKLISLEGYPG